MFFQIKNNVSLKKISLIKDIMFCNNYIFNIFIHMLKRIYLNERKIMLFIYIVLMKENKPHSIVRLLKIISNKGNNTCFSMVQNRVFMIFKINNIVNILLSEQLRPWVRVINFRKNIIVLETINAIKATKFRYEEKNLFFSLRKEIGPSLSSIKLKINPSFKKNHYVIKN